MGLHLNPNQLRSQILRMAFAGGSVHVGCAFSMVEIVSVLLGKVMNVGPKGLAEVKRDRIVTSKGHGIMAVYAAFKELGWLEAVHLEKYFSDGSLLHGLCEAKIPGLEVSSGSLGHGLPIATGMALGFKRIGTGERVFCIVGDGEMNEGPMWEALLFAAHQKLDNLVVIVDANGFQAMGEIKTVLDMEPFPTKFASFGWEARECDGHDMQALEAALTSPRPAGKPLAIVARTVKGKGVSFMEHNNEWHYRRLNPELLEAALNEVANEAAGEVGRDGGGRA